MLSPKGRILIVDDEPLILEMFESILAEEGYDIAVASDSQEAGKLIAKGFFDVLICDVRLEELDGFDVVSLAKEKNPNTCALLITGAPAEEDAKQAEEMGALYLSKPIGFDLLVKTVDLALEQNKTAS